MKYQIWSDADGINDDGVNHLLFASNSKEKIINFCKDYFNGQTYYNMLYFKDSNHNDWDLGVGREKYGNKAIIGWDESGDIVVEMSYQDFLEKWPFKLPSQKN